MKYWACWSHGLCSANLDQVTCSIPDFSVLKAWRKKKKTFSSWELLLSGPSVCLHGSYESVSKRMLMCGRDGVSRPPESQGQHIWYPTFFMISITAWELEGYQLASCASKPQLMCSNLGTITSPGPSALIGAFVAATQASPCCSTLPVMNCAFCGMTGRLVWIFILLQAGISVTWSSCVRCNFTRLNWEFLLLLCIQ